MSDNIACWKKNAIDHTTYHLAQAFHMEINEESRLINAGVTHSAKLSNDLIGQGIWIIAPDMNKRIYVYHTLS